MPRQCWLYKVSVRHSHPFLQVLLWVAIPADTFKRHLLLIKIATKSETYRIFHCPPAWYRTTPFREGTWTLEVLPGRNITFTSATRGTPPFKVGWFRGARELVKGDRCNIYFEDTVAELELFNVDISQRNTPAWFLTTLAKRPALPVSLWKVCSHALCFLLFKWHLLVLVFTVFNGYALSLPRTSCVCEETERSLCRTREIHHFESTYMGTLPFPLRGKRMVSP